MFFFLRVGAHACRCLLHHPNTRFGEEIRGEIYISALFIKNDKCLFLFSAFAHAVSLIEKSWRRRFQNGTDAHYCGVAKSQDPSMCIDKCFS